VVSFMPWVTAPSTTWIGGWVGHRAGLDTMAKRKYPIITLAGKRIPVDQAVAQSLY